MWYKYLFHSSATIAPLCIYQFEVSVTPWKRLKHLKIGSFKSPPPPGQKSLSNAPPTIEWFFELSMNVVELSKVTYWFLVLLLGFLLVSIVLWCRNFFLSHFLTKEDSLPLTPPLKDVHYTGKSRHFWLKCPTWARFKFPAPPGTDNSKYPWVARRGGGGKFKFWLDWHITIMLYFTYWMFGRC